MAIDANSYCPCGSGKKVKFCCNDLFPELQKIDRMLSGKQFASCVQHIDRVMEKGNNRARACLLAMKCMALGGANRREELINTAADFLAKHPDNQIALAESAISIAPDDALAGYKLFLRAMRSAAGNFHIQTYGAMRLMATLLRQRGFPIPARELTEIICTVADNYELLSAHNRDQSTPLLLRDELSFSTPPEDAPWRERFLAAMGFYMTGDWLTAAERFEAMAVEVPDSPRVWYNLAMFRALLADNPGAIEAFRRYSALRTAEEDGLDDAAEAEAIAMFLSDDPLGDQIDALRVEWTVKDAERSRELLLSSPLWESIDFTPASFDVEDSPPPKGIFMLRDRPAPDPSEDLNLERMPRVLGQAMLFGRQTDREARLEIFEVWEDDLQAVADAVADTLGDAVEPDPKRETLEKTSAFYRMMRANWNPPRAATVEQFNALKDEYVRHVVYERWPERKLGVLDGRSPLEASADRASHPRLLGAIMVIRFLAEDTRFDLDFDPLYERLGLPKPAPIDPRENPLDEISTARLDRIDVERLSDQDLLEAFTRAFGFAARSALRKLSAAIIDRPSLADPSALQAAYAALAQTEFDLDRAVEYVEQARKISLAERKSCADWDIMELSLNYARGNIPEFLRLLEHIGNKHSNEPGVQETMVNILMSLGFLRPDGTPAINPADRNMMDEKAAAEPAPAGLWTPEAEPAGGGGKLWMPGD